MRLSDAIQELSNIKEELEILSDSYKSKVKETFRLKYDNEDKEEYENLRKEFCSNLNTDLSMILDNIRNKQKEMVELQHRINLTNAKQNVDSLVKELNLVNSNINLFKSLVGRDGILYREVESSNNIRSLLFSEIKKRNELLKSISRINSSTELCS